jgi:hypothetical protein
LPGGADENHEEPMLGRGLTEIWTGNARLREKRYS